MSGQSNAGTILLSLLVAAVIGAAAWLLYFSPTVDDIEQTRLDVSNQEDLNFTLQLQVNELAGQFERLPETIDEIVLITQDVPPVEDTPDLVRDINAIFEDAGLLIQELTIGDPLPVTNMVSLEAAAAEYEQRSYIELLEFRGLVATTFSVTFVGPAEELFGVLEALQFGDHRYFLVNNVTSSAIEPAGEEPPRPEIGEGWIEATVGGSIFTLTMEGLDPSLKPRAIDIATLVREAIEAGATVPADPDAPPPPPPAEEPGDDDLEEEPEV